MNPPSQPCGIKGPKIRAERGLVLFIALIALLVISLAAVALIRSVDTSTLIVGNIAAKQSATNVGEAALIEANNWVAIRAKPDYVDPDYLRANHANEGYYAWVNYHTVDALFADATWQNAASAAAPVWGCDGQTDTKDCTGNEVRYIIERMCSDTALTEATPDHCLFGPGTDNTSSQGVKNEQEETLKGTTASVMYRVTARITGPKGTVSYIQSFVY